MGMTRNLCVQQSYGHAQIFSWGLTGLTQVELNRARVKVNLGGDPTRVRNQPGVV